MRDFDRPTAERLLLRPYVDLGFGRIATENEWLGIGGVGILSEWLKKPEGAAPMAKISEAAVAMIEAKKHAPRATARLPKEKQKDFVKNYQIEINKLLRNILDLEDAMLTGDHKAAEQVLASMKDIKKAGHKVFKPRRRRAARKIGGNTAGGGDKPRAERPQSK